MLITSGKAVMGFIAFLFSGKERRIICKKSIMLLLIQHSVLERQLVKRYFSKTSAETAHDKLKRIIVNDYIHEKVS